MNELSQIFDTVNIGLVILDRDYNVRHWNRWMSLNSGIAHEKIIGSPLFDFFPDLNNPSFTRNCKSVLSFGNFSFFSQKLHRFLFPFKPVNSFDAIFDNMQQSCTLGPLRNDQNAIIGIFLIIQDVTELASYEQRLMEMNTKDPLTGLFNRRHLESRFKEELERQRRHQRKTALIMFDIDHFKLVNDTYGHPCGDVVLKTVASETKSKIRVSDCLARYGGEEFCRLLPETGLEQALIRAERFRKTIEDCEHALDGESVKVTISLGVSELAAGDTLESFLKRADDALYEA